jgi:hypothetical protein
VTIEDAAVLLIEENFALAAATGSRSSVAPLINDVRHDDDDEAGTPPAAIPPHKSRVSEILESEPVSLLRNFIYLHVVAMISATISFLLLFLILTYLELLFEETNVDLTSLISFNSCLVEWLMISIMRRAERRFRYGVLVSLPSSVGFVVFAFWLAGGNVGAWAFLLNIVMGVIYSTCTWSFDEPEIRGNIITYCLHTIPVSAVCTIIGFVPPYAIAVPARLLVEDHPVWYALWCGVGYPAFAFVIRKAVLSFCIKMFAKTHERGRITSKQMVSMVSTTSFIIAASLLFGNTMLLYLSSTKTYALVGALSSIGTEVIGKLYTVKKTQLVMNGYLKAVVKENLSAAAKLVAKSRAKQQEHDANKIKGIVSNDLAGDMAGMRHEQAAKMKDHADSLEGMVGKHPSVRQLRDASAQFEGPCDEISLSGYADSEEEDEKALDEKTAEEYWDDVLAMFALRWSNEIIAEKACILVAGMISNYAGFSPHSVADQIQIVLIFIVCEAIADFLLVYSLDRLFKIPFLRLSHEIKFKKKEFWATMIVLSLNIVGPCLMFIHAHGSAEEWFPGAGIATNGTSAALLDATNSTS